MNAELRARLLRRDGRCSDLTLERWIAGELSPEEVEALEAHLQDHDEDRARVEAIRQHDAQVPRSAPQQDNVVRFPFWATGGIATALAAGLTLVALNKDDVTDTRAPTIDDGILLKSGALDFEVFVHDGKGSRQAREGEITHPGDRVGFRLKARSEGFVLVAGVDEKTDPYPCWPAGEAPEAAHWTDTELVQLDLSMKLDATPGAERFVAVLCDKPFAFSAVREALVSARAKGWPKEPTLTEGCTVRMLRLEKRAEEKSP